MKIEKIIGILTVLVFWSFPVRADHYDISYTAGDPITGHVSASPSCVCPNETANVSLDREDFDLKHYRPAEHDNPDHEAEPKPDETVQDSVSVSWSNAYAHEGPFSTDTPGDYFFCPNLDDAGTYYDDGSLTLACAQVTVDYFNWDTGDPITGSVSSSKEFAVEEETVNFSAQATDTDNRQCCGKLSPLSDSISSQVQWSASRGSIDSNGTWTAPPVNGPLPVLETITARVDDQPPALGFNEQGKRDDVFASLTYPIYVYPKKTCEIGNVIVSITGKQQVVHMESATYQAKIVDKKNQTIDCTSGFNITWLIKIDNNAALQAGTGPTLPITWVIPANYLPCGPNQQVNAHLIIDIEKNGVTKTFSGPTVKVGKGTIVKVEPLPTGFFKVTYSTGYEETCDKDPTKGGKP